MAVFFLFLVFPWNTRSCLLIHELQYFIHNKVIIYMCIQHLQTRFYPDENDEMEANIFTLTTSTKKSYQDGVEEYDVVLFSKVVVCKFSTYSKLLQIFHFKIFKNKTNQLEICVLWRQIQECNDPKHTHYCVCNLLTALYQN